MLCRTLINFLIASILSLLGLGSAMAQIQNGGFESLQENGSVANWILINPDSSNNVIEVQQAVKYEGKQALRLHKKQVQAQLMANSRFQKETDQTAKLIIKAKVKSASKNLVANFFLQTFDGSGKRIGGEMSIISIDPEKQAEWQELAFPILISPDIKSAVLFINLGGQGELFVDDLGLEWANGEPSPALQALSQELLDIIQKNSIVSDSINWEELKQLLPVALRDAKTAADEESLANFFLGYLRKAQDYHSHYYSAEKYRARLGGNQKSAVQPAGISYPTGKLLEEGIAYVQVPAIGSLNPDLTRQFADSLNRIIMQLQAQQPQGWVVDLMYNSGGNMYPMIGGLNALIPDGKVMGFVHKDSEHWVEMADGRFGTIQLTQKPQKIQTAKVAVLISRMTASSGEMSLIALLNNPHARSFGLATAGLTSANTIIPLSNSGALALASAVVQDLKGEKYFGQIQPMQTVKAAKPEDILQAAIQWILAK